TRTRLCRPPTRAIGGVNRHGRSDEMRRRRTLDLGHGAMSWWLTWLACLALSSAACAPVAPGRSAERPPDSPATNGATGAAWEQQWNDLVAAARQEGTVVVLGPPTPELRQRLPEAFRQRFGITIEYTGQPSGDFAARLATERSAGMYSADI